MADDLKTTLKSKVEDFLKDIVTLDVITLTGEINLITNKELSSTEKDSFKWDSIFKKVAEGMKASQDNKVSIVAYTHAEWDQDSVNYVANGADEKLVEAHKNTVTAAHESRMNAIKSLLDAVDKL